MGKTFTLDPISKKRVINRGEEDQYYIKEHHPGIISEEIFEKAQAILRERSKCRDENRIRGNYSKKYPLSSKMYCGYCGSILTRRTVNSGKYCANKIWQCMQVVKKGKFFCDNSKMLREDIIENAFVDVYNNLLKNEKHVLNKFIQRIEKNGIISKSENEIKKCERNMELYKRKVDNLFDLYNEGSITKEYFKEKNIEIERDIQKEEKKLDSLLMEQKNSDTLNNGVNKIKYLFEDGSKLDKFDEDLFKTVIKYVIMGKDDDPYFLRFILKNGSEFKDNKKYNDTLTVLEFESKQKFHSFEKSEKNYKNKVQKTGISISVEIEM